ncbi:hypothetical protein EW145_g3646 [Phellinidium pouzarii]|uniref:Uncharacterized protein n=1 Tax=Phellinidium pouzarii TaxID=167371 RepID=A0A4S4L6M7_9AGAM|nr:hypothetical protein EW145_g3646 [Phellinidium pouzarii]
MVNIVSSAITNKPPPPLVAHLTHLGNKLHNFKFDENTHENLMSIFDKNPNPKAPWYKLNWRINHTTLSARNYCVITENAGLAEPHAEEQADIEATNGHGGREGNKGASAENMEIAYKQKGKRRDPSDVTRQNSTKPKYSLDVAIHAEVNPRDSKANTIAYEFIIPILDQDQAVHEKTRTA